MLWQIGPHMQQFRCVFKQHVTKHVIGHTDSTIQKQWTFQHTHLASPSKPVNTVPQIVVPQQKKGSRFELTHKRLKS